MATQKRMSTSQLIRKLVKMRQKATTPEVMKHQLKHNPKLPKIKVDPLKKKKRKDR